MVLIMLILSVYILQQNSDILDKMLVNRIGRINNFSKPPNLRHILNKGVSRKSFWKRNQDLRRKIDSIAALHGPAVRKPVKQIVLPVIQSRNIVYNRIDKAGSTTLISKITFHYKHRHTQSSNCSETLDKMAFQNSFHLIGQGTPNVRYFYPVQKAKLANMLCGSAEENLIYTRHMYYTNITEMGCNVTYFNMVSSTQVY